MISSEERMLASDPSELLVKSVGAALRRLREDEQMSQETFAARLQAVGWSGNSPQTVSAWERGDTPVPLPALPAIADVLRIETSALTRRLGLCGDPAGREVRLADATDFVNQLADEPPETAETILRWARDMIRIAHTGRLGRTN
jgi:transcriptional regulator with XRE-family HTH domain